MPAAARDRIGGACSRLPAPIFGALSLAACAALVAGCGGGTRQDAGEAKGSYQVKVLSASFPVKQAVARPTSFRVRVKNTGAHTVPNLAVTVDSFNYTATTPELAANKRPVWVIEKGPGTVATAPVESQEVSPPGGGQTAYVNTWALGPLASGATQTFTWRVMPVKGGSYTVHYSVAAGLSGKAVAELSAGGAVQGRFAVQIAGEPPVTHVDPSTGKIVAGVSATTP